MQLPLALAAACAVAGGALGHIATRCGKKQHQQHEDSHWLPHVPRNGILGSLITRVGHYAVTVEDVARSLAFYVEVLGLQQIRRPNFDRHGAWLTAGNIEIHLIKGKPVVPEGDHLVVCHLAVETDIRNIDLVLSRLTAAGVPFSKNVSVPTRKEDGVITQYFLRDPDGYYIEICNCDLLTKFCLSKDERRSVFYNETSVDIGMPELLRLSMVASEARRKYALRVQEKAEELVLPAASQAASADRSKLQNMLSRTTIWGDIMQGETKEAIGQALMEANNHVPLATRIIRARKIESGQVFVPPGIYKNPGDTDKYQPAPVKQRAKVVKQSTPEEVLQANSPEQLYSNMFDKFDTNKSGQVSKEEAVMGLRQLCPLASMKNVEELYQKFDKDNDGQLHKAEFTAMCSMMQTRSAASKWNTIFELCDDDGNGKLTVPEIGHKLRDLGLAITDEELEELFLEIDTNGDGYFGRQEFLEAMMPPLAASDMASVHLVLHA